MFEQFKKHAKTAFISTLALSALVSFSADDVSAKEAKTRPSSFETALNIEDWGPAVTKVVVEIGRPIPKDSVTKDTFDVHVKRSDPRLEKSFLEEGSLEVLDAYVSDKKGEPAVQMGKYVVLEMKIGPSVSLGYPLNYSMSTGLNAWTDNEYTITQQQDIETKAGTVSGLVIDEFVGQTLGLVEQFSTGQYTHENVTMNYADYAPEKDKTKNPLVIWLHGGGEGGDDPTMPLSANKAAAFASPELQSYFDGAYVLAPQAPTRWMDGETGPADGTSIYQDALKALIDDYVSSNPDIDPSRIYIGGASNGGYMTLLMTRDYPGYFAAAFPVCEGLNDKLISGQDIADLAETPTWFVTAANDTTLLPEENTIPTYNRLVAAGAEDVHMTLFDNVVDTSGTYFNEDGTPYEYPGHFSWIYVYNNDVETTINGETVTLMEWLASQTLN